MLTHTQTATTFTAGAAALAVLKFVWLFITTFFSLLLRITRGLMKFIGLSILLMTDMW